MPLYFQYTQKIAKHKETVTRIIQALGETMFRVLYSGKLEDFKDLAG
jgi:hypothetical protein